MSANLMSLAHSGGKFLKLYGDRKMVKQLPYYCEVEYLESTGQQHIDTGIKPSEDLAVYITFSYQELVSNMMAFGSRSSVSANDRYWINYDRKFEVGYGNWHNTFKTTSVGEINTIAFNEIVNGNHIFTINGKQVSSTGTPNTSVDIIVFGSATGSSFSVTKMKLYSMSMRRNGVLIRDFIPVLDREMRPAMYDRVTGKLFYNEGAGEFISGPAKTI